VGEHTESEELPGDFEWEWFKECGGPAFDEANNLRDKEEQSATAE
jgi:hypothetical protein